MDRKEFDSLAIDKQIEFINNRLEQHKTLTKACAVEGLRRSTVRDRFQGIGYKLVNGKFIKGTDSEEGQAKPSTELPKENTPPNTTPSDKDTIGMIKAIQKELEQLKEEVQELKHNSNTPIKSNSNLTIMSFTGLSENKSYRIDSKVSREFNSFCKKHNEYKKQDLLSQALKEFIDKYK